MLVNKWINHSHSYNRLHLFKLFHTKWFHFLVACVSTNIQNIIIIVIRKYDTYLNFLSDSIYLFNTSAYVDNAI